VVSPLAARAQQPAPRMRRIGMLNSFDDNNPAARSYVMEMFQALSRLGWESGRNVQIVQHWAAGNIDRAGMLAKELVTLQPELIIAVGTPAAAAMQRETRTIPIVFTVVTDPVGAGLVARKVLTTSQHAATVPDDRNVPSRSARPSTFQDHYSITSSARASSAVGNAIPSAFAVLRLRPSWTFVICWTGRSPAFSPLRIRPV
jgi:hypothetical protein